MRIKVGVPLVSPLPASLLGCMEPGGNRSVPTRPASQGCFEGDNSGRKRLESEKMWLVEEINQCLGGYLTYGVANNANYFVTIRSSHAM